MPRHEPTPPAAGDPDHPRLEQAIADVMAIYAEAFDGWSLANITRPSIRNFLRRLPEREVYEAMEAAVERVDEERAWRYFCGICWNKIRGRWSNGSHPNH